jgi:signal transduction histidine kinase/ligand-binding sensor domain-containing protein
MGVFPRRPVLKRLLASIKSLPILMNRVFRLGSGESIASGITGGARSSHSSLSRERFAFLISAFVLWGVSMAGVGSVRAAQTPPNYFTRVWQTTDGLPDNNVTSVVQTRDGYLWIGTRSGLARFNGVRFTVFDGSNTPEMQSRHVTSLFEANDGTLWIGHENGEVTEYKNGNFKAVPVVASWRGGKILGINADANGDIWLLNQDGDLARVKDGLVHAVPSNTVVHLVSMTRKSGSGGFWIQRGGAVLHLKDGELSPVDFGGLPANGYVQGICVSQDGGLWILTESLVRKWKDGIWSENRGIAPWELAPTHFVLETKDRTLIAATFDHGLFFNFADGSSTTFSRTNGFSTDWITSVCEDQEGNLWAGTGNGGLAMIRAVNVTTLSPPDQWQGRAVLSVAAGPDDALLIGTEGAGLYRYSSGVWTNLDAQSGVTHRYIWSVAKDTGGRMWVGSWGGGLFAQTESRFERQAALGDLLVAALEGLRDGGLCIGTGNGLMRYEKGEATWLARKPEIFSADVRAVKEGRDGAIWFGMCGGGLGRFKDGKLRQFRRVDGLSSDFVQCIHVGEADTLWIGTSGGGINRFKDGHFAAITRSQGLMDDIICDIEEDHLGNFWISSHGGVMRVSKAELDRCADDPGRKLRVVAYGLSDGMPTLECSGGSQPAGCTTRDGHVWFATARGVVGIDPGNVRTNWIVPPVTIEEMRVDGHAVTMDGSIRVSPGRHRLEFDYAGLSFTAPERVSFKYRLEGLEKDWVDAGTKRLAPYSYIPPGDYAFRVKACNNDGCWNETGAVLAFTVLPFFWQTWAFRVFAGLTAAAGVAGVVLGIARGRMRRKVERLERQQALERERARIAKDIHDDLGASLTRITLLTQSTRAELNSPQQVEMQLDRIYGTARELTRAMDEIVWAVNPQHDTLDSLATYLGKYAHDYLRAAGIRCKLDVPVQLPGCPLTAEVRHNVFLAFKEALHNVVKHSRASAVRIILALKSDGFALTIEDNGCGFDANGATPPSADDSDRLEHGNGLLNIKRRLSEIGGECQIHSAPKEGTRLKMEVRMRIS